MASALKTLVTGFNLTGFPADLAPLLAPATQQECLNSCPELLQLGPFKTKTLKTTAPVLGGIGVVGNSTSAEAPQADTAIATLTDETQSAIAIRVR
jgi:hypothetical protein